ncbi:hypothetical protein [Nocardioides xinjiangensis]|uniref:hypothetical protein n=1 Tax=Nocardioides xinjiangensis TaxID=2817376 RepID=UPI001B308AB8|nr:MULTISPECIES: hypothetical protein [unclassified Nocardioides]
MPGADGSSIRRRLELGRLLVGSLLEVGIKAYGAGAALSVAVSDAETVGGKSEDALAAVPNLVERYRAAQYVVDHRQEIQAALDHVNQHTPPQEELEDAAERSSETLRGIDTTYSELLQAWDTLDRFPPRPDEALGHVRDAWGAKPDLDSIRDLAEAAGQVGPYVDQVDVLIPVYSGSLLPVVDNFASDEVAATLGVMAGVLALAFVVGRAVGFWVRRGRPGLVARTLQRWGARTYRRWYVRNLPYALSPPLYAAARERIQRDIVADPQEALDPETLRELELYFAHRAGDDAAG